MRNNAVAFVGGLIFAAGLAMAGMTQPAKIIGFLDFFGHWDPTLMFVMGGAVMVSLVAYRLVPRMHRPVFAPAFQLPTRKDIDARLVVGAALFGIGWALAGFCPGPGIVSLATGTLAPALFVASMIIGMIAFRGYEALRRG